MSLSAQLRNVGAPFIKLNVTGNFVQQKYKTVERKEITIPDFYLESKTHEKQ
jgi:hypothetical protein